MAATQGVLLLLKYNSGTAESPVWTDLGSLRSREVSINSNTIDITTADSSGRWQEMLSGGGTKRVSISGDGVFDNSAAQEAIMDKAFDGTHVHMQVTFPDYTVIDGQFVVDGLNIRGNVDEALTFSTTFQSAGAITKADVT